MGCDIIWWLNLILYLKSCGVLPSPGSARDIGTQGHRDTGAAQSVSHGDPADCAAAPGTSGLIYIFMNLYEGYQADSNFTLPG